MFRTGSGEQGNAGPQPVGWCPSYPRQVCLLQLIFGKALKENTRWHTILKSLVLLNAVQLTIKPSHYIGPGD